MDRCVIDLTGLPAGTRLRLRRVALGLSQAQLAALAGTSVNRVSEIEHNSARYPRLSHALDQAVARLEAEERGVSPEADGGLRQQKARGLVRGTAKKETEG